MADSFKRRINILQMLKRYDDGTITIPEIIKKFAAMGVEDIKYKNIERDMSYLSSSYKIYCDESVRPFEWWWDSDDSIDIPGMGRNSALTFNLAKQYLDPLLPQNTLKHLQPKFRQSKKILSGKGREKEKNWIDKIRVVPRLLEQIPAKISTQVQEAVYQALYEERMLKITYHAVLSEKISTRRIHPLALLYRGLTTELLACEENDDQVKRFILNRINKATVLIQSIKKPEKFNLDNFIQEDLGFPGSCKEIKFKARLTNFACTNVIEMPLSKFQKIEKINDDEIIVTADVRDTVDLTHWIFSLGSHITVLEPEFLKENIAQMITQMGENYK